MKYQPGVFATKLESADLIGIDDRQLTIYSLRHSFRQMLRNSNLNIETIDKIFGHEGVWRRKRQKTRPDLPRGALAVW